MTSSRKLPARSNLATHWSLDERTVFLNHGSYGACPRVVLERQSELRNQLESQPVDFLQRQAPILLQQAKDTLKSFLKSSTGQTILIPNATFGVNAILANFPFGPKDEILVTNHGYRACTNAAREIGRRRGFTVRDIEIPYPIHDPGEVTARVLSSLSSNTKLLLIDHITSPTALVFPIPDVVRELNQRGIESLIDGARASGINPH